MKTASSLSNLLHLVSASFNVPYCVFYCTITNLFYEVSKANSYIFMTFYEEVSLIFMRYCSSL